MTINSQKLIWLIIELAIVNSAIIWAGKGVYSLTNIVCIWFLLIMNAWVINVRLKLDVTEKDNKRDKNSHRLIMLSFYIGALITIYQSAHYKPEIPSSWAMVTIGSIVVGCGLFLRILSIRALGKYFTARIQVSEGQSIMRKGVYKYIRHPAYLGIMLTFVGIPIIFSSFYGFLWMVVIVFSSLLYRINVEEEMLIASFGKEYTSYMRETKRFIPFIF